MKKKKSSKKYNVSAGVKRMMKWVDGMVYETNLSVGKLILANDLSGKYASFSRYNDRDGYIEFYIYSIETETTVCTKYRLEEFAKICSTAEEYTNEVVDMTETMLARSAQKSKDIIYINKENRIIL